MRNIFTLLILISLSSISLGQTLSQNDISGKWKVEKVVEKPTDPELVTVLAGFENATFDFNQNGYFQLTFISKSELFIEIAEMTNGTKWKIEKATPNYVKIGNQEDDYSIMGIIVREINGKIIFYIDESELALQMNKIE